MKMKLHFFLLALAVFLSSVTYGAFPCDGILVPILEPQSVTNIDNHIQDHDNIYAPYDKIALLARWMGHNAVDNSATWNVSNRTGFTPVSPIGDYQRCAINATDYTAFQMQGTSVGMFINTYTFPWQDIIGGGPNVNYVYNWSVTRPIFSVTPDSSFVMQMDAKLPWVDRPDAGSHPNSCVTQLTMTLAFKQVGTNKCLNWVVLLYDPRGGSSMNYENVMSDTYVTFISTSLSEGRNYITRGCNSNVTQSTPWSDWKYFRFHITRQNMINSLNAANTFIEGVEIVGVEQT